MVLLKSVWLSFSVSGARFNGIQNTFRTFVLEYEDNISRYNSKEIILESCIKYRIKDLTCKKLSLKDERHEIPSTVFCLKGPSDKGYQPNGTFRGQVA